jgi:hypothetical protein
MSAVTHRLGGGRRPVLRGKGPAAGEPGAGTMRENARRAPSTCEAACLREANWYATTRFGASEAIQISANRGECGYYISGLLMKKHLRSQLLVSVGVHRTPATAVVAHCVSTGAMLVAGREAFETCRN